MKKIYHLASCTTCQRILREIKPGGDVELQDIKQQKITPAQLDEMARLAGSYEALFSRRAIKFRSMGLAEKKLTEEDYRRLILEEYTFLKRPVIICGTYLFEGSAPARISAAKNALRA